MKKELLNWCRTGDYQRDNFDKFLKAVKFSFKVPSVHIAGSNGKGSTTHFLEMSYINAGYKVGSFTSPYLYEINELIKVNNSPISDDDFEKIYKEYEKQFKKFDLSEFEVETFIAFTYFTESKCDICFIECGMGGAFDATNVFDPILCVITSVSLEHTAYLGKTVAEIAYHKAGIFRDEVPVVVGKINEEAELAILEAANEHRTKIHRIVDPAKLTMTDRGYSFSYEVYPDIVVNNFADYIVDDACIALESINYIKDQFPISIENIQAGFASDTLTGRLTILKNDNHIIIDGAHNPEGCAKLASTIMGRFGNKNFHIVFACFRDKNLERMLANLGQITSQITLTSFPHERCRNEEDYFLFLGEYEYNSDAINLVKNLRETYPDDYILIAGSLAFTGYMLDALK